MIKRILSAFAAAVLIALCCLPVYGEEEETEYPAASCKTKADGITTIYVIKQKEEDYICEEKFLPSGTALTFAYEEKDPQIISDSGFEPGGKYYAYVEAEIGTGYVCTDDIVPDEEVFSGKSFLNSYQDTYVADAAKGVEIRKGPSRMYDTVAVIPQGETFTVSEFDSNLNNPYYGYVNYGGKEGWVYVYDFDLDHAVCYKVDSASYFAGKAQVISTGVYLADIRRDDGTKYLRLSDDIPLGTTLKYDKYCYLDATNVAAYTEYNGTKGWLTFSVGTQDTSPGHVLPYVYDIAYIGSDSEIYSKRGDILSGTGKAIPAGTLVNLQAFYLEADSTVYRWWLNVEYRGKDVWITADDSSSSAIGSGMYALAYVSGDSIGMYDSLDLSSGVSKTLYYGERLSLFASIHSKGLYWYYVNTPDGSGIVRQSDLITLYASSKRHALRMNEDGETVMGVSEVLEDPGVETTAPAEEDETEETKEKKDFPLTKVLIGAGAAVIIAAAVAVSAVTTVKKNKKED